MQYPPFRTSRAEEEGTDSLRPISHTVTVRTRAAKLGMILPQGKEVGVP